MLAWINFSKDKPGAGQLHGPLFYCWQLFLEQHFAQTCRTGCWAMNSDQTLHNSSCEPSLGAETANCLSISLPPSMQVILLRLISQHMCLRLNMCLGAMQQSPAGCGRSKLPCDSQKARSNMEKDGCPWHPFTGGPAGAGGTALHVYEYKN